MNILFVTENHSISNYGITTVVSQLADELVSNYSDVHLYILATCKEPVIQNPKINITLVQPSKLGRIWGWNLSLFQIMDKLIEQEKIDIVHIHGIWMAAQWNALQIAKKRKLPCVVSAHGMLEPWLWNKQSRLQKYKKILYFNLLFRSSLTNRTVFHAITSTEKQNLSKQLQDQPIVIIPNAISLITQDNIEMKVKTKLEKQFLFLGRLHPKKGVDILIDAFNDAHLNHEWRLVIAGPDSDPVYTKKLRDKVEKLGLSKQVLFQGTIIGSTKVDFLRKSWAVVVPSFSEVVGMVNLEAAKYFTPSITTIETGLLDWEEGGGILIHPNVNELCVAIKSASEWTTQQRLERGNSSFQLIAERYSWNYVIYKWMDLYNSLVPIHNNVN